GVELLAGEAVAEPPAQLGDGQEPDRGPAPLARLAHLGLELFVDHPPLLQLRHALLRCAFFEPGDPTGWRARLRTRLGAHRSFGRATGAFVSAPRLFFRGVYTFRLSARGTPMWLVYAIALILGGGIVLLQVLAGADHHIGAAEASLDAHHAPTGP